MNLLQNGVIAMLAAVGLSTLVWLVVSTVTRLGYHPAMPMWFVIPARGDAPELQQTVHELEPKSPFSVRKQARNPRKRNPKLLLNAKKLKIGNVNAKPSKNCWLPSKQKKLSSPTEPPYI